MGELWDVFCKDFIENDRVLTEPHCIDIEWSWEIGWLRSINDHINK